MKAWKKLTSVFMSVVLVVGLCPGLAYANGGGLQPAGTPFEQGGGDGEVTKTITVTNNVPMFKPANEATLKYVGEEGSENYAAYLVLPMLSTSLGAAFIGEPKEAEEAEESDTIAFVPSNDVEGQTGTFTIPVKWVETPGDPTSIVDLANGEPFTLSFKSANNNNWYGRTATLDEDEGTLVFDPWEPDPIEEIDELGTIEAVAAALADGTLVATPKLAASLIDAIYVQYRDEKTDLYCASAKMVWDKLTPEEQELVEGDEADPDYFGRDTGDASLDDPRNTDGIGDNEILVVSFGTSFNDSRVSSIKAIEDAIATANPDWSVRRAFTAQIIINHIQSRDSEVIDNMDQALERAEANGVKNLIVQPTHLMHGAEYDELVAALEDYQDTMNIAVAEPLLGEVGESTTDINEDKLAVARAAVEAAAAPADTALVLMGHGTSHEANISYSQMQTAMDQLGYTNVFVGTVEGEPEGTDAQAIIAKVKEAGYSKVILRPLMVVAGDHAHNDMADPDDPESWYSQFVADEAFDESDVTCQINGLGEIAAVQQLYVSHLAAALPSKDTVKAAIGELSADPRDFTEDDLTKVEAIQAAYDSLSAEDQAALDEETAPGKGQSYGRVLEAAVWAVYSYLTDDETTLDDATYTTTTDPAVSSESNKGKSTSDRKRNWWVESVTVADGHATAKIYVTAGDATASKETSYPSVWSGGETYEKDADNNYSIPVDLNGKTYFGGVSSSMPRPIMYELTTTIAEPNKLKVTFDSNGGSTVARQKVDPGATATEPEPPTLEGYTFKGWKLDGEDYDFSTPVTENITLVAEWEATQFLVDVEAYKGADGSGGAYGMFIPTYNGAAKKALVTTEGGTASLNYYNARNTYNAIYVGEVPSGSTDGCLGQKPTEEQKNSAAYITGVAETIDGTASYVFTHSPFDLASLGNFVPFVTVSRSKGLFNATQLSLKFGAELTPVGVFDVEETIEALPAAADVTVRDQEAIEAARAAYDALPTNYQEKVSNYDKLEAAEEAFANLPEMSDEAKAVETAIEGLITSYVDVNETTSAAVANARTAFEALDAQQKAYIDDACLAKLARAEACVEFVNEDGMGEGWIVDVGIDTTQGPVIATTLSPRPNAAYLYLYVVPGYDGAAKKSGGAVNVGKPTATSGGKVLLCNCMVQTDDGQGRAFSVALKKGTVESDQIDVKVPGVYGPMAEGTYSVAVKQTAGSEASVIKNASIQSNGADMTATFTMADSSYDAVFLGTKDAASVDAAIPATSTDAGSVFTASLETMYQPITVSYHRASDGVWVQETIEFVADEQTQACIDKIADLNLNTYFTVTADQREAVQAAAVLYDALNAEQTKLMATSNGPVLQKVRVMFSVADSVAAQIEALPAADDVTAENATQVYEVKAAFDGMGQSEAILALMPTGLQNSQIEKLISQDLRNKLTACVTKADQAVAGPVIAAIDALPAPDDVTSAHYAAIKAARAAYNALTDAQKACVTNYDKLTAVEAKVVETIELTPHNGQAMFKVVNAFIERNGNEATFVFSMSSTGYKYMYNGLFADALTDSADFAAKYGDNTTFGNFVYYAEATVDCTYYDNTETIHEEGEQSKYQFRFPITDEDALAAVLAGEGTFRLPITGVSDSHAKKAIAGTETWEQALFARQGIVDLGQGTVRTDNYQDTVEAQVSSEIATMAVGPNGEIFTVGNKSANEFTCQPTFKSTDGNYDKAFIGSAEDAASAASADVISISNDGTFTIPLHNALGKDPQINIETWEATVAFHVAESTTYAEANTWVERTLTVNPETKKIVVSGAELTRDFSGAVVTLSAGEFTYTGADQRPTVDSVTLDGVALSPDAYVAEFPAEGASVNAGTYTVKVTSTDPTYSGFVEATYKINAASIDGKKVALSWTSKKFNNKVQKPVVKMVDGKALKLNADYTVKYSNPKSKNAGAYKMTVTGKGNYTGTAKVASYKIVKAANTLKVTAKKQTIKVADLKKANQVIKAAKAFKVKKAKGKVTYAKNKKDKNKNITVAKKGKVTVKKDKKAKATTFNVKVNVSAAGNKNYNKATKMVTLKIVVKK